MRADNNRQVLHPSPSHLDMLQSVPMVGTESHTSSHGEVTLRAIVVALGRILILGRNVPRKPRLGGGVEGHNMQETSSAHILFATDVPGKPRRACPVVTGWAGSFTLSMFHKSLLLTSRLFH